MGVSQPHSFKGAPRKAKRRVGLNSFGPPAEKKSENCRELNESLLFRFEQFRGRQDFNAEELHARLLRLQFSQFIGGLIPFHNQPLFSPTTGQLVGR